ncbi:hypothetical protein D3C72_2153420 [compost metagenome]
MGKTDLCRQVRLGHTANDMDRRHLHSQDICDFFVARHHFPIWETHHQAKKSRFQSSGKAGLI